MPGPSQKSYAAPMSKKQAKASKMVKTAFTAADQATKRVIAPYVSIVRKGRKAPAVVKDDRGYFSYYLQRKPSVLMRNLSQFLADINLPALLHETAEVLKIVTDATSVRLYMVDELANEIYFDALTPSRHRVNWKIEPNSTVAAYAAYAKEFVMIDDILEDARFPEGLGYKENIIRSVLCVPIVTPNEDCISVIELGKEVTLPPFTRENLKIVVVVTGWMGAAIHQNQERLSLQKKQELNDYLLNLTKCYFADAVGLEQMISEVVGFAKTTLGAERGSFYIIEKEKDELVADHFDEGLDDGILHKKNFKVRITKEKGIAASVAKSGVPVNIKDAIMDPRFNKDIDTKLGIIPRSVLCFPIMGLEGILGIIQLTNKKTGSFTTADEVLFNTFTVYCGLALQYSKVYINMQRSEKYYSCALRMLKYHMRPCIHDVEFFRLNSIEMPEDLDTFAWYRTIEMEPYTPQIAFHMLMSMMGTEGIDITALENFTLTVRNSYQPNGYHNWEHAFNVTHCMYNILIRNEEIFSDIEKKALIISCICHDLDHGGFTNNFLILSNDILAQLYEESTLENHHYYVSKLILSENQIFPEIPDEDYKCFMKEIKDAIIATDLAQYFRSRVKLIQILQESVLDWENQIHRGLVKSIMMTTCDLSGNCKPFPVAKVLAMGLYREFYHQGDIEKSMGLIPLSMMDRDKEYTIPVDQVQFLNVVVMPCCDLLKSVFPNTQPIYDECIGLREAWKEIIDLQGEKCWRQDESVVKH